jgi:hypothetical protein
MKWITREKIKVDWVAGPWLIRNVVCDAALRRMQTADHKTGGTGVFSRNEWDFYF